MPLEIISMTLEDLPEVLRIEESSFPRPFSRKLFETEFQLAIAHLYAAKLDGRVAGYIDFWNAGAEIHLINIAVDPEARRHGVASRLMETLIGYATQNKVYEIYLDVRVSNQGAIELYKRFGFSNLMIRRGYYQDNNEDAQVMSLVLSKPTADQAGGTPGVVEKEGTKTDGPGPKPK